jgi:hypothetical protein
MKLANASCLSIENMVHEDGVEAIEIEEMDGEQLAWLVRHGDTKNAKIVVQNIVFYLDPTNIMRGAPPNPNIFLKAPKDEIIKEVFEKYVVLF